MPVFQKSIAWEARWRKESLIDRSVLEGLGFTTSLKVYPPLDEQIVNDSHLEKISQGLVLDWVDTIKEKLEEINIGEEKYAWGNLLA